MGQWREDEEQIPPMEGRMSKPAKALALDCGCWRQRSDKHRTFLKVIYSNAGGGGSVLGFMRALHPSPERKTGG